QYDPLDLVSASRPLELMADRPSFGFSVVEDNDSNPRYPWDRPPLTLRGQMIGAGGKPETVVLVPMGSTILRRTFFAAAKN
ncbi:MAG: hypothetical protein ACC628_22210, partial [Pirellulaceae bacterium]